MKPKIAPKIEPPTRALTVTLRADVVAQIKVVAAVRGVTVSALADEIFGRHLGEQVADALRALGGS